MGGGSALRGIEFSKVGWRRDLDCIHIPPDRI
jgi:hypothetical protein